MAVSTAPSGSQLAGLGGGHSIDDLLDEATVVRIRGLQHSTGTSHSRDVGDMPSTVIDGKQVVEASVHSRDTLPSSSSEAPHDDAGASAAAQILRRIASQKSGGDPSDTTYWWS
eukprot:737691-Karenia_brevis.AAC.1